jgi:hypothetical protein
MTKGYTRKCPRGYSRRKGYTRKNTGKYVHSTCVKGLHSHAKAMKTRKTTRKHCPQGMIPRVGYFRKISSSVAREGYIKHTRSGKTVKVFPKTRSVYVKASCIKDLGKPGKGKNGIGPLRKGDLSKYGYSYKLSEAERREALQRAIRAYGPLTTFRKLNAVAKLSSLTNPSAAESFAADRNWIRLAYGSNGTLYAN